MSGVALRHTLDGRLSGGFRMLGDIFCGFVSSRFEVVKLSIVCG